LEGIIVAEQKERIKTRGDTEHTLLYPKKSMDSRAKSRIHCAGRSEQTEHMHSLQNKFLLHSDVHCTGINKQKRGAGH
jgi:hypothetical protein